MTMIDPATGWFEIEEVATKRADVIANVLETTWLTRYPLPTEVVTLTQWMISPNFLSSWVYQG